MPTRGAVTTSAELGRRNDRRPAARPRARRRGRARRRAPARAGPGRCRAGDRLHRLAARASARGRPSARARARARPRRGRAGRRTRGSASSGSRSCGRRRRGRPVRTSWRCASSGPGSCATRDRPAGRPRPRPRGRRPRRPSAGAPMISRATTCTSRAKNAVAHIEASTSASVCDHLLLVARIEPGVERERERPLRRVLGDRALAVAVAERPEVRLQVHDGQVRLARNAAVAQLRHHEVAVDLRIELAPRTRTTSARRRSHRGSAARRPGTSASSSP